MNTPSELDAIVHEAGRKLQALQMTRIVGSGDLIDSKNLNQDLDALCNIIDPMLRAIGDYARASLGISEHDVDRNFTDQLRGALEGNATHSIEQAGQQAHAYLIEAAE